MKSAEHVRTILYRRWQESGLSQAEFARSLKMTPQAMSLILRGERRPGAKLLNSLGFRRVIGYEEVA